LQKIGAVTMVVVSSDPAAPESVERTSAEFSVEPGVKVIDHRNRGFARRFRWAFDTRFLNVHGCVAEDAGRARLLASLGNFDLIWVLNSRTPNILNLWRWPNSVLDADDIPSAFQRSVWQNGARLKEKWKAGIQMQLLRRRERFWKERFNVLSVCSEADREYLGGGEQIHVIPNGFERPSSEPARCLADPPRIGFIGLYSYQPNLEGMNWFLRECWPQVKRQIPNARLRLVGKDTNGPLMPAARDVDALGYLDDPSAEITTWSAMIVPVLHGAGTRVKIADGFSRKCPVVSTSLGAFGYDIQSSRELLLADDGNGFANACVSLVRNPSQARQIAERAFAAFLQKWTWDAIAPRVWAAAEDALSRKNITL
jgi:glycosyltransferase involved in cell wall biosynthesis